MSNAKLVTKDDLKEMYQRILPYLGGSADAGFTPIGTIIAVMGKTAPANYLPCDGRVVNISDYPELANYFKEQFGSSNYFGGDGTTTFGIVDLSGEFLRGTGTNSHTNQGSGAEVGEHQDASEHRFLQNGSGNNIMASHITTTNADSSYVKGSAKALLFTGTESGSSSNTYTSRPTNTSVLFCIATKNIYLNPSLDFSTSEKVVGTWIDGKPIYQKTFNEIALPVTSSVHTWNDYTLQDLTSLNLDTVVSMDGLYRDRYDLNTTLLTTDNENKFATWVNSTKTILYSKGEYHITNSLYVTVTLRYTKTTD